MPKQREDRSFQKTRRPLFERCAGSAFCLTLLCRYLDASDRGNRSVQNRDSNPSPAFVVLRAGTSNRSEGVHE